MHGQSLWIITILKLHVSLIILSIPTYYIGVEPRWLIFWQSSNLPSCSDMFLPFSHFLLKFFRSPLPFLWLHSISIFEAMYPKKSLSRSWSSTSPSWAQSRIDIVPITGRKLANHNDLDIHTQKKFLGHKFLYLREYFPLSRSFLKLQKRAHTTQKKF